MKLLTLACAALAALVAGAARGADVQGVVGSVTANPLTVELTTPAEPIKRGRWFKVLVQVSNAGAMQFDDVTVTLVHPQGFQLDRKAEQTIARLPAFGSKPAKWEACSSTAGSYIVLARAEAGAFVSESPAQVVQILTSGKNC
jgi:uncharacterized membrane protein